MSVWYDDGMKSDRRTREIESYWVPRIMLLATFVSLTLLWLAPTGEDQLVGRVRVGVTALCLFPAVFALSVLQPAARRVFGDKKSRKLTRLNYALLLFSLVVALSRSSDYPDYNRTPAFLVILLFGFVVESIIYVSRRRLKRD